MKDKLTEYIDAVKLKDNELAIHIKEYESSKIVNDELDFQLRNAKEMMEQQKDMQK